MKKVSIIVPIYNVELYLRKCLDSIINQSYSNLEIILIDDGSTDRSGEICDEYSKLDNRIIVIHNNNKGVSYSRNYGIRLSTGKYILFIDSDDTVDKNYVYYLLMGNKDDKYDIVYCGIRDIFEYKKKCIIKDRLIKEKLLSGELKKDYYFLIDLLRVSVIKLYNADIIKKYDISKYIRKLLKERSIFTKCKGDIMERSLKVYQKMKKIWNIKVSGNQEKLKAYQMVYTIPYGISENFFLGFLGFFGSFSKSYMCIVIFSASFFYFIYKEKKRQRVCFVLKEIEKELLEEN